MIPTSGVIQLHYKNLCKSAVFSNSTKKDDAYKCISKFLYDIGCINRALGNSIINSFQGYLHYKILLRNMIPTSGVRQLHCGNSCKIAALINFTKKCDAYKWH